MTDVITTADVVFLAVAPVILVGVGFALRWMLIAVFPTATKRKIGVGIAVGMFVTFMLLEAGLYLWKLTTPFA